MERERERVGFMSRIGLGRKEGRRGGLGRGNTRGCSVLVVVSKTMQEKRDTKNRGSSWDEG